MKPLAFKERPPHVNSYEFGLKYPERVCVAKSPNEEPDWKWSVYVGIHSLESFPSFEDAIAWTRTETCAQVVRLRVR